MGSATRYWRLVRMDATGKRRLDDVAIAKTFFQQQFPEWSQQTDLPDATVQRHLIQYLRNDQESPIVRQSAEACLRCYISTQIEQVCIQLESQFGLDHGFNRYDLYPFVLDDDGSWANQPGKLAHPYHSLATELIQTFDPSRASLSTWVIRLVRHNKELNGFLLQQGVYLVSDWAILNDTTPKQLRRILAEFHAQTPHEIDAASRLLDSYHRVYRRDRLEQRQQGVRGQCSPPNSAQLHQMVGLLQPLSPQALTPETVMSRLQALASQLRQYRIYVRSGRLQTESLDQPETQNLAVSLPQPETDEADGDQNEFLTRYRALLLQSIDQTLAQVTHDRLASLQKKKSPAAQQFLDAMRLFHCQGKSMGEIATLIGLQAQYQVTRLMKLKEFRADVRQRLLVHLSDRLFETAKAYAPPERLRDLDQQLNAALDEQIGTLIQDAETEASIAKHRPFTSLFSRRLCHHLDSRRVTS